MECIRQGKSADKKVGRSQAVMPDLMIWKQILLYHDKDQINSPFSVFHQNIRGLSNKTDELLGTITPRFPHVLFLTEHHCKEQEIESLTIENYILAAKFCRLKPKQGGTCIFVHDSLPFANINLQEFSLEQDIEICAVNITSPFTRIEIICIYRSPTSNFSQFIKSLDEILSHLTKTSTEFIFCGDININYLHKKDSKKQQLDALLTTFNLINTIDYPTRRTSRSRTAVDNIFTDTTHEGTYSIYPIINGVYQTMMVN